MQHKKVKFVGVLSKGSQRHVQYKSVVMVNTTATWQLEFFVFDIALEIEICFHFKSTLLK